MCSLMILYHKHLNISFSIASSSDAKRHKLLCTMFNLNFATFLLIAIDFLYFPAVSNPIKSTISLSSRIFLFTSPSLLSKHSQQHTQFSVRNLQPFLLPFFLIISLFCSSVLSSNVSSLHLFIHTIDLFGL